MAAPISDQEAHRELAAAIGSVTLTWALAESALALAISLVDRTYGPIEGHEELPRSLTKKVKYLRKSLLTVPALKPVAESGNTLASRFVALKERRHILTHGVAMQVGGEQFKAMMLHIDGRTQTGKETSFTISQVYAFCAEVVSLANKAGEFVASIANVIP